MQTLGHDDIQTLFARHGLRCTRQRVALYRALASSAAHPTADELYQTVSHELSGISVATIYNCLEAFCGAGLARKLPPAPAEEDDGRSRSARFDASMHHHLHIRCTRTGAVRDVPDDLGERLLGALPADVMRRLEEQMGFKVRRVQIELIGEKRG
jgi:Fe2+ or Zn2+ uptake regulation protein